MTTVTAVRRALEETARELGQNDVLCPAKAGIKALLDSRYGATILANRLSDRGDAGNAMSYVHLAKLMKAAAEAKAYGAKELGEAIEWAIDQLTPPEVVMRDLTMSERCDRTFNPNWKDPR